MTSCSIFIFFFFLSLHLMFFLFTLDLLIYVQVQYQLSALPVRLCVLFIFVLVYFSWIYQSPSPIGHIILWWILPVFLKLFSKLLSHPLFYSSWCQSSSLVLFCSFFVKIYVINFDMRDSRLFSIWFFLHRYHDYL